MNIDKPDYVLIHYWGCPSMDATRRLLRSIGIECREVCIDDLLGDHILKNYSSPTLLHKDKLVFGERLALGARRFTTKIPTGSELRAHVMSYSNSD